MKKNHDGKYRYLAMNTLFLTISEFGSKFLAFFLVPLYTSVLSTEDYGIADVITTSVTLMIYICTLNIGSAVLRFTLDNQEKSKYVIRYAVKVLAIGSFFVGSFLAIIGIFNIVEVDSYVLVFVVGLFISQALESILFQYLRGIDKVGIMSIASFLATLARLTLSILTLVVLRWGLLGYLVSMTAGPCIAVLFSIPFCRQKKSDAMSKAEAIQLHKDMRSYSIPTAISQLGWWMNNSIDRYLVVWLKGAALNGIYAVSYKIPSIMSMICNIFCQAWGISVIKEFDPEDKEDFFSNTYILFNSGLCIICSLLIIVNIPISKILFQKEFFEAWKYSSFLVLGILFSGLSSFVGGVFTAVKKTKLLAIATISSAAINVILNTCLIPEWGAYGAAIATAISFFFCWLINMINARRFIRFKYYWHKDVLAYALLIGQIILEHIDHHCYYGQVLIIVIMVSLYFKQYKVYVSKIKGIMVKRLKKR